jgi:acylphosphatase
MSDVARRVRVHGRVQGVFFRESARREAERLGVRGWVANRDDGSVEAHLEGEPDAVSAMVAWCESGPPRAHVDSVDVEDAPVEDLDGFRVR